MDPTINLSAWRLDPDGTILREPPRPPAYRELGYDENFDFTTVFYDAFWNADGGRIFLIGPPLMNLKRQLGLRFESGPTGTPCSHAIDHRNLVDRVVVAAPPDTDRLLAKSSLGEVALEPQPNLQDLFRGKRVILTKNKDNQLAWIHDWALFHQRRHGCDAVLIYDTGSTRYASSEIADALSTIQGLDRVAVIDWPFPWGVRDGEEDSNFTQRAILEHARFRLLSSARSVLQGDVDELVLTKDGESVFELTERSAGGYLRYRGKWIETVRGGDNRNDIANGLMPRHQDFYHVRLDGDHVMGAKWTCVPAKLRPHTQWTNHKIIGADHNRSAKDRKLASRISFYHFKAINTGWKIPSRADSDAFEADLHRPDHDLKRALEAVFADSSTESDGIATRTANQPIAIADYDANDPAGRLLELEALAFRERSIPSRELKKMADNLLRETPDDPRLWFLFGKFQRRHGDVSGAISSLQKAIELDATYALVHGTLGNCYSAQGKIEDATAAVETALQLDPDYYDGHRQLSRLYAQQGRIVEAIASGNRAADQGPGDPAWYGYIGNLMEQQGSFEPAIAAQRKAISLGEPGAGPYRRLTIMYAKLGHYGKAIDCAWRAVGRIVARRLLNAD